MNPIDAFTILKRLGVPALATADAAAALGLSTAAASQTLTRLAKSGLVRRVRHGIWWLEDVLDPLRLPELVLPRGWKHKELGVGSRRSLPSEAAP